MGCNEDDNGKALLLMKAAAELQLEHLKAGSKELPWGGLILGEGERFADYPCSSLECVAPGKYNDRR